MAEVTREMIQDYMIRKGGVVKNVDLVRHFRKFLQLDDPVQKEGAREIFKERVNQIAYIRAEKGEKYLYLRQEHHPAAGLQRPPSGRPPIGSLSSERSSVSSIDTSRHAPPASRDSYSFLQVEQKAASSPSHRSSDGRTGGHLAGSGGELDIVLQTYRPISSPPPKTTTINDVPSSLPTSLSVFSPPPPPLHSSPFSPPPPPSHSSLFSPPLKTSSTVEGDGESLLAQMTAELSNFGSLFSDSNSSHSMSLFGSVSAKPPSQQPPPPRQSQPSPPRQPPPPPPRQSQHSPPRQSQPTQPSHSQPLPPSHSQPLPPRQSQPLPPRQSLPPPPSHSPPQPVISPLVNAHPPPSNMRLGPSLDPLSMSGLQSPLGYGGSRRQGSLDGGSFEEMQSPVIRMHSPLQSSDSSSPHNGSPQGPSSLPLSESRARAYSSGPPLDGVAASLGVPLRREQSPRDGKIGRSHSNAQRRSRNFDKSTNLDSVTRASIVMTPPTSRRNKSMAGGPMVAPKPSRRDVAPGGSREDLALEGDDEGSVTAISEGEYYEIDPLEREWMLASAQGDMDRLHHLMMTDSSLVNRRDFLHGYTALHWAAKQGRCDIITAMMMNGALVDLKSGGGFTPLHMAAQAGHDNAIHLLIRDHGASVNSREHSGRRPVDLLNNKCSEDTKAILTRRINNYGFPIRVKFREHLPTFSQPHRKRSINRQWWSVGDLLDKHIQHPEKLSKKRLSPRMSIRKTFSFRRPGKLSPKKDTKENKR